MSLINRVMDMLRTSTTPIRVPRTMRTHSCYGMTSMQAGKMVPLTAIGMLREDSIRSGRLRYNFEMMETAELVDNPINVRLFAYYVPFLAFERFKGSMEILNKSWEGKPFATLPLVPFIETERYDVGATGGGNATSPGAANPIMKALGLHAAPTELVNTAYYESYNLIWNHRAKNRSKNIPLRGRLQKDLAPAFWYHDQHRLILSDYDIQMIDGAVALSVTNAKMPVKGIGLHTAQGWEANGVTIRETGGGTSVTAAGNRWSGIGASERNPSVKEDPLKPGFPEVFAELQNNGITVSLSNIEQAKKTQAFAKLRQQYNGHDDEDLINMLMDGLTVPEAAFRQPMLVGEKSTVFGMNKRFATDGASLSESATNGACFIDISIQIPQMPTGGVLMIVAEITPEQIFERQKDPFLFAKTHDDFPHYLKDELQQVKVDIVKNSDIDVRHATPNATFGYAPKNWKWHIKHPRIGGKYFRPDVDGGFVEDRQRIWTCETANPTLSEDWYLATNIHQKVFAVTTGDNFEVVSQGECLIEGTTVFGPLLFEGTDDYAKVAAEAPPPATK